MRALLALIALLLPAFAQAQPAAPPVSAHLPDGRRLTLAQLRGRVVLINFWATWCVPCRAEVPLLNRYYASHAAQGLTVIGIAVDTDAATHRLWISHYIHYPQADAFTGRYGILGGVPTSYVIGRDGTMRYAAGGALSQATLDRVVTPLLR